MISENTVTATKSSKSSTSGLHEAPIYRPPLIYSSRSETDNEMNTEQQITQLALSIILRGNVLIFLLSCFLYF